MNHQKNYSETGKTGSAEFIDIRMLGILDRMPEIFILVDPQLTIIWSNKAAGDSLLLESDIITGRHCYELWHQRTEACDNCPVLRTLQTGRMEENEVTSPDGRTWFLRGSLVFSHDGKLMGLMEYAQDITLRRKTEMEREETVIKLKELNDSKDRFFSILAHDLRSPISTIYSFLDYAVPNFNEISSDEMKMALTELHHLACQSSELTDNLLHWSRSQLQNIKMQITNLDLSQMINETVALNKITTEGKGIILSNEIPQNIHARGDFNMISMVLRNLISNAVKYTDRGGLVTISAKQTNMHTEVTIADTGLGIPAENQKTLFMLGKQVITTGTQQEKGTGLGLVICKDFVEKCGGTIKVYSGTGKGSRFVFSLPNL